MIALSISVATIVSGVGSLTVSVSMESATELDPSEFQDVEPSSVKFGATGNESIKISGKWAFHLHHREYSVSSGPGDV